MRVSHLIFSLLSAFFMSSFFPLAASSKPLEVRIPAELNGGDNLAKDLLKLALDKSGKEFAIREVGLMNQKRASVALEQGGLDVIWMGTGAEIEKRLKPIRIPLYRGLMGYRLFIIHKDNQSLFGGSETLEDLARLITVQGDGWSDVEVLEASGLTVRTAEYQQLFDMINFKRAHLFPRGISEAYREVGENKHLSELAVEQEVYLHYPFAFLFFTSKDNPDLNEVIHHGLEKAYEDGSFLDVFNNNQEIQIALEKSKLNQRRGIYIKNDRMSEQTLNVPEKYWHIVDVGQQGAGDEELLGKEAEAKVIR